MEGLFLQLLNMNLTASYVILAVVAARLVLRRAPAVYSYALWSAVLFRLVCPISFESLFSLMPVKAQGIPANIGYAAAPQIDSGVVVIDRVVNSSLPAATPYASVNPMQVLLFIGANLWVLGAALLLLCSFISTVRLQRHLRPAQLVQGNVYRAEGIQTPFVFGVLRPKIYLPSGLDEGWQPYILQHEQTHIQRLDHIVKPVAFLVVCIHWFNPLVWLAFFLMERDMERACDERVLRQLGGGIKKEYSSALLALATKPTRFIGTLAFGESGAKQRIKNILRYQRPAIWVVAASIAAVVALVVGLSANPKPQQSEPAPSQQNSSELDSISTDQPEAAKLLTFWVKPDEPPQVVGETAVKIWLQSFMQADTPAESRISDYTIEDVTVIAGTPKEGQSWQDMRYHYVVRTNYTIQTASEQYLSPSDGVSGLGSFSGLFRELCVKSLEDGSFEIVSVGTGGGEREFAPQGAVITESQRKTLENMGFTPEEINRISQEEVDFIFYRVEAVNSEAHRVGEYGELTLDYAQLGSVLDSSLPQWVRAGDRYLNMTVKKVETRGYLPYPPLVQAITYTGVRFEGEVVLQGRFSLEQGQLAFVPDPKSDYLLPTLPWVTTFDVPLYFSNPDARQMVVKIPGAYDKLCEITINGFAFEYQKQIDFAPGMEEPIEHEDTATFTRSANLVKVQVLAQG